MIKLEEDEVEIVKLSLTSFLNGLKTVSDNGDFIGSTVDRAEKHALKERAAALLAAICVREMFHANAGTRR